MNNVIIYRLSGVHIPSDELWDYNLYYDSYDKAEAQRQVQIEAYTYEGICDWEFIIEEIEVR